MKTYRPSFVKLVATVIGLTGGLALSSVGAATKTIVSPEFSVGYGFVYDAAKVGKWSVEETDASNVEPGDDFDLSVEVEGGPISPTGASFIDRTLQEMTETNASGLVSNFLVTIEGNYSGPKPADAAADPKYKVTVNIEKISIYAAPVQGNMGNSLGFSETTYGNEQKQKPEEFTSSEAFGVMGAFQQLQWEIEKQSGKRRTFELIQTKKGIEDQDAFAIDGFEVTGTVEVTYESK